MHLSFLLRTFFWEKPTASSFEYVRLQEDSVPDILVCRDDGFDVKKLAGFGYNQKKISEYVKGRNDQHFIGWSGGDGSDPLRKVLIQHNTM